MRGSECLMLELTVVSSPIQLSQRDPNLCCVCPLLVTVRNADFYFFYISDLSRASQSVPSSPSPGRPAPSPSASMSTFAAALRDLAKNAGEEPIQKRVNTPGPGAPAVTSSLLDVRKVRRNERSAECC